MQVSLVKSKSVISLALTAMLFLPMTALAATPTHNKPQYLPPLPAALDPSGFAPAPKPAPQAVSPSTNYTDEPADAVSSAPDRTKDLLRQALEAHNQNDTAAAERIFKQVLAIDPQNADANFNLGAMYEDKGDLNGALRFYKAASAVSPSDKDIQDALNGVSDKIRQQRVAQDTQAQVDHKLQLKRIAQDAAAAYKAGKYDQAIQSLNRIAAEEPNDPNVQYGLGQAYRGKGDVNRAKQYLNRAISLDPNNGLYKSTMNDLSHDTQRPQVANGGPAAAPDYSNRGYDSNNNNNSQDSGLKDYGNPPQVADNQGPAGQLTPFDNSGDQGGRPLYGHAYGSGGGGLGGLGSLIGLGGLGAGMGMMGNGGMSHYGGTGNRLIRRAAMGSLSGAAVGALTNMHGAGGLKAGAIRGALYGGLFGLMSGF